MAATSIAGGFLVFLYEKNWLEAIITASQPRLAFFDGVEEIGVK
ncbi:hypothetical protein [Streptococcus suis]|nr:hypothetical protein [Streptococcus suis]